MSKSSYNKKLKFLAENFDIYELGNDHYIRVKDVNISYLDFCDLYDNHKCIVNRYGYSFKISGLRLNLFRNQQNCVFCGLVGDHFHLEFGSVHDKNPHLNFYGINSSGEEVLMTRDHILPVSHGGKDILSNLQTMCSVCNSLKGDVLDDSWKDPQVISESPYCVDEAEDNDLDLKNFEDHINLQCLKLRFTRQKKRVKHGKFKSGLYVNTIRDVIMHPILGIPAYVFFEDDTYVECRRCLVLSKSVKLQSVEVDE